MAENNAGSGESHLRRVLGLTDVTAGGIGIIVGAGIYVLIGTATAEAGAGVWLAFALAAGISFLTALSYMELASMFPSAAGEYEYTRQVFPDWVAFSVGWIMIAGLVVAAAAVSLGFAHYLTYFVSVDLRLSAVGLLVLVSAIATTGIKESVRLTLFLSAVQVGGLLFVIVIGIPHLGQQNLLEFRSPTHVLSAAALVFFAFIGFDEVITLSEETKNPTRTVPIALALALSVSALLYILVAMTSVSVLGASALGESSRPLADVIDHVLGTLGGRIMAAFALVGTTNTVLLAVTAASRLLYGMAERGSLPRQLSTVSRSSQTPIVAIATAAVVAALFVLLRDLKLVASTTDFAVYVVFLFVNASVILLRFTQPKHPRGFTIPGTVFGLLILPALAFVTVTVMISQLDVLAVALGAGLLALGIGVFLLFGRYFSSRA